MVAEGTSFADITREWGVSSYHSVSRSKGSALCMSSPDGSQ